MRQKIKWLALGGCVILLVYTRFVNLSWGLPYPFHPDERNMAAAVQQLQCPSLLDIKSCFNPNFFAYGQLQLYLSYVLILISRIATRVVGAVQFEEAVLALRFISASASVAMALVLHKIFSQLVPSNTYKIPFTILLIFSPALIQFAHFGTTESVLMFLFTLIILLCLKLEEPKSWQSFDRIYVYIGVAVGLAIATKVSAIVFASIPFLAVTSLHLLRKDQSRYQSFWQWFNEIVFIGFVIGATTVIFSPHNLISWKEFIDSMEYESAVAVGSAQVFYTRTFTHSIPVLFQFQRIYAYALGLPVIVLFLISFFTAPFKWKHNILRFSFLVAFLPWAFIYAKWTRFIAPTFPLILIFSMLLIFKLPRRVGYLLCGICIIPGVVFMKVYLIPDVRFQASEWMSKNIPNNSYIIQETANVIDLPVYPISSKVQILDSTSSPRPTFRNISFNFYELDNEKNLPNDLKRHLAKADYIIMPSRRIFMNHSAKKYPLLADYYKNLFSGKLGFTQVAEFKVLDDEAAEETWTVFDHPVVRIYKRR